MPNKRKSSKQREMFDPHQPLLEEQENEILEEEREVVNLFRQAIKVGTVKRPGKPGSAKVTWPKSKSKPGAHI
jgi:hypothetical protein